MALANAIHESLPYIDAEPTPAQRTAAQELIAAELASAPSPANTAEGAREHEALPPLLPSKLSPLMSVEMARLASSPASRLHAIDLSRYESLAAPGAEGGAREWRAALHQAYASQAYLSARTTSLSLLESYGRNAWLMGNAQLEAILRALERDLAERKTEIDAVVIERKGAQEAVGAEMRGLEETWKRGVGRVLETEVAAEGVRREILERRRAGAA